MVREREQEVRQSMQRAGVGLAAVAAGGALLWQLFGIWDASA
jgi:hypothetical protein